MLYRNELLTIISNDSNAKTTTIDSNRISVTGELSVESTLQTPQIISREDLVLVSERNELRVHGNESLLLEATNRDIDMQAGGRGGGEGGGNITLTANEGMVRYL